MVMAITAADDWTQKVSTPPKNRKMRVVRKLSLSNEAKKFSTSWFSPKCRFCPVVRNTARAKMRKASPKRKSPM